MPTRRGATTASPVLVWTAILILYLVWGSTYLGIRIAVGSIPPFAMAAGRFAFAGIVLITAVVVLRRGSVPRPSLREWRDSFIVGAFLMGGGMGAVAWGEQTVPSGIAALLIAMMPVWVAVFGRIFLGERLPRAAAIGIATGMVGVVILVGPSVAIDRSLDPAGIVALIISPMSWAAGSLFSAHRARLPKDPFVTTGMQMVAGSTILAAASLVSGELTGFRIESITTDSLLAVVYLTAFGSLVAFTAYAWVLRHAPLPLIATYAFVNPVVAVFLGWLILQEQVTLRQVIAGAVIVAGVALIVAARSRMTRARPAPAPPRRAAEDEAAAA
ncbi:MAG TPA: EamA family transporter [Candidatus Limnocylindrales bacterium]|nr:EamA family transporter [Candidatus Limnocylindrales bacterium]